MCPPEPARVPLLAVQVLQFRHLRDRAVAGHTVDEHAGVGPEAGQELPQADEAAEGADGHVALETLRGGLALLRREDARGEDDDVGGGQGAAEIGRLGHEGQVLLDEGEVGGEGVLEGAPDDGDGGAAAGGEEGEGAPDPGGAPDDDEGFS